MKDFFTSETNWRGIWGVPSRILKIIVAHRLKNNLVSSTKQGPVIYNNQRLESDVKCLNSNEALLKYLNSEEALYQIVGESSTILKK